MRYLKKISTLALFATTVLGSIPFAHAMEQTEEIKGLKKLPFTDIKVEPANKGMTVLISVEETEKGNFRPLTSFEEAEQVIKTLITVYGESPEDEKKTRFPLGIRKREEGTVVFKEAESDDAQPTYRLLTAEQATEKLQTMLASVKAEESKKEEPLKKRIAAERIEAERLEEENAATLQFEKEKAELQAVLEAQVLALEKQNAQTLRQRQEQEIAALKAQLALQAELSKQQEAAAEQERLRLEKEAAVAAQETLRIQQEAAAQAEALRLQQQEAVAAQETLRIQQEAAVQQQTVLGYTPERIEHNINTEITRGAECATNFLKNGKWKRDKKHKK